MSAVVLANTANMPREEWLELRRRGIGGSDAAAVAGLDPYRTPIQVWLEKTGQIETREADSEAAYWGHLLEDVIAKEFARRTGLKVRRVNAILQHPDRPYMIANVDRKVVGEDALLEIKTINAWHGRDVSEDKLPDRYVIQGMHYMSVTGARRVYFAVLVGGQRLIVTHVDRDNELIAHLTTIEDDFWRHVETRTPPPVDGSDASRDFLASLYKEAEPDSVAVLPPEATELIRQWREAKEAEKAAAERRQEAENRLKAMLGDREIGRIGDLEVVTWKTFKQERLDTRRLKAEHPDLYRKYVTASTYRRFQIREVEL